MDDKTRVCVTFFNRFNNLYEVGGWSLPRLSRASGLNEKTLGNYRHRTHLPNAVSVAVIAEAMGVTSDWLLGVGERR